jgi:DNA repair protein RadC
MGEKPPKEAPDFTSGHRIRMREKLRQNGGESLSPQELLEMLLYFNFRRGDVKPLVKSLYGRFETLDHILHTPAEELMEVTGIGRNTADMFALIRALFYRLGQKQVTREDVLSNWEAVLNFMVKRLGHEKIEKFMVIYLNSQNEVIADEIMSSGTVDRTAIFPREIAKQALHHRATAVIIVHNHPTGHLRPSKADIDMTRRTKDALNTVDIILHDHIIVGGAKTVSFKSMGSL